MVSKIEQTSDATRDIAHCGTWSPLLRNQYLMILREYGLYQVQPRSYSAPFFLKVQWELNSKHWLK